MRRMQWVWIPAVTLLLLGGCATGNMVLDARSSLGQAKAAGAMDKAPYEYTAAEEYLKMAEHEHEENDCKAAREFAQKSAYFSEQAMTKAKGGAQ